MCGICGFTGASEEALLRRMTESLAHRGPDDEGYYSDGQVSLGMRRLSIIDIETGRQPVHNEDKNIWVVFNGEIYNHIELRKELEEKGHRFYTDHSDTEVLVHLYEEEGLEFLRRLNGMFAIALWDTRSKELFLIRDRMGVKPLFYSFNGTELVFGSEIKAILAHTSIRRQPHFEGLYHYFTFKNVPAPFTAFNGIYALEPAHILVFHNGKAVLKQWWKINFMENELLDERSAQETIISLLEDSTKLRMRSDAPFGAYLSGGVDSSAVVAFMSRFSAKPIKTFSLGYGDEFNNKEADLFFARKVSRMFNTEHYEYIMSCRELAQDIENVIGAFDQPFSGTISTYFLTKLIHKHVKVALSGDAADELFGSYLSHRLARPLSLYAQLRSVKEAGAMTLREKQNFDTCDIGLLEDLFLKSKGKEADWRYCLYQFNDFEKNRFLTGGFKENLKQYSSYDLVKKYFSELTAHDPLNRILEMEWNTQLPDQVLAFVDFLSMAHSVEIRSPFLDYRLVEFVATIPGSLKIKNGTVKDVLKKAVHPFLPKGITDRAKEGFVLPVFSWMENSLKEFVLSMLSPQRLKRQGMLDGGAVSEIVSEFYAGKKANAAKIWNLVMFEVWWEKYFA